jgi:hypothetical protein
MLLMPAPIQREEARDEEAEEGAWRIPRAVIGGVKKEKLQVVPSWL